MGRDALLLNQPVQHRSRTVSRISDKPLRLETEALLRSLDHGLCRADFGLATLAISLTALWLTVIGLGLIFLGVPPGGEEIARSLAFPVVAIFYAGVWLSLAMLLSVGFARRRWSRSASGCS